MSLSRRTILATGALVPLVALPMPAMAIGDDDHIEALALLEHSLQAELCDLCNEAEEIEFPLRDAMPEVFKPLHPDIVKTDPRLEDLYYRDREPVPDAALRESGLDAARAREHEVDLRHCQAFGDLFAAETQTARGILIKLNVLHLNDEWRDWEKRAAAPDCRDMESLCMLSVRRDLERLAGRARA